jgi:hypothetical protein
MTFSFLVRLIKLDLISISSRNENIHDGVRYIGKVADGER